MAVKWELLEERSGLINRVIYLLATVESPQQFILMACCEFSNKWQESWLGKEHRILKNKKRLHISKRHSQGCSCYYNTMKHYTTKFAFVCCVINKIYLPSGPIITFQSTLHWNIPTSQVAKLQSQGWRGELPTVTVHNLPWQAQQSWAGGSSCGIKKLGCLFGKSTST